MENYWKIFHKTDAKNCLLHYSTSLVHSLQLLFVVLVCLFIQTKTWGKPAYSAQTPDEQLGPSQDFNETEVLNRGKRQVTFTLANVCPAIISTGSSNSPSNGHPCVKRWYFCPKYNLYEAECHSSTYNGCTPRDQQLLSYF